MLRPQFITRRAALVGLGGAAALAGAPALAKAPMLGALNPVANRFKLGAFEVTTILDGQANFGEPHPTIGANVDAEAVKALAVENNLPPDQMVIPFTPTLVNTGKQLILFDTGNGAGARPGRGNLRPNLEAAGYRPEDVDLVVLTHMHPDHIGGLVENGEAAYPNATYAVGAAEWDFWTPEDKLSGPTERVAKLVQANIMPHAEKYRMLQPGDAVASGIEAVASFGHTPGHMAYHIESDGQRLMLTGDISNHYVLSLQRPDWHFGFDGDKDAAVKSRRDIFGMIAADKIPFVGYHMPFPAVGYVEPKGDGFEFAPETYQLDVG